jgi:hypothetical protein
MRFMSEKREGAKSVFGIAKMNAKIKFSLLYIDTP